MSLISVERYFDQKAACRPYDDGDFFPRRGPVTELQDGTIRLEVCMALPANFRNEVYLVSSREIIYLNVQKNWQQRLDDNILHLHLQCLKNRYFWSDAAEDMKNRHWDGSCPAHPTIVQLIDQMGKPVRHIG